ncbi:MAG: molybdopterin-dependent oxidoreductase, partial [Pseudomonadota bacterium]
MTDDPQTVDPPVIGGGAKKLLYALDTARRIGPGKAAKALTGRNTCKACALGMGGQAGGMTNERGTFPSVCNKSVQAQSTDIQPPIAEADLRRPLADLRATPARLLEKLGRLNTPLHKPAGGDRYAAIGWGDALDIAAARLAAVDPQRSFFYSSGRSSNEAGFLFQLIARLYGTNNVSNCSYYCHQATSVALGETIGTGTATVELADLDRADLIFVVGANPASNHPRLIHELKACRDRGGAVIVINPAKEPGLVRFASPKSARAMLKGGDAIASDYLQPRIGGDIWLFKGIAKAVRALGATDDAFIGAHTDGYADYAADIDALDWPTIETGCGVPRAAIERVAARFAEARSAVFAWGMGMTHHLHGVENIEAL